MRYTVIRDCYWNRSLYLAGEVVELGPEYEPPEHFAPQLSVADTIAQRDAERRQDEADVKAIVENKEPVTENAENGPENAESVSENNTLENMNVPQLQKLAREYGIEVPKTAKKTELIAAIRGE